MTDHEKAIRYDDLIATVRELDSKNKVLLTLSEDDPGLNQAWSDYEAALHEVLEFAWEDDHADAMERAGVTCNELHNARVARTA